MEQFPLQGDDGVNADGAAIAEVSASVPFRDGSIAIGRYEPESRRKSFMGGFADSLTNSRSLRSTGEPSSRLSRCIVRSILESSAASTPAAAATTTATTTAAATTATTAIESFMVVRRLSLSATTATIGCLECPAITATWSSSTATNLSLGSCSHLSSFLTISRIRAQKTNDTRNNSIANSLEKSNTFANRQPLSRGTRSFALVVTVERRHEILTTIRRSWLTWQFSIILR